MRRFATRRAFTLIEILITLALLTIMLVIAYDVMMRMFFSGTVTQWETNLTTEFTNADSRIRDYLNSSSYPSLLTPQGNAVLNHNPPSAPNEGFLLAFPADSGDPPTKPFDDMGTPNTVLRWFKCEDGRMGIEGLPNQAPKATQITLKTVPKGKTRSKGIAIADLVMEEAPVTNLPTAFTGFVGFSAPAAGPGKDQRMVSDVRSITVKLFGRTPGALSLPVKDRVQVEIEIKCVEPAQANAERTRKITAEANVGAKKLS
jgi:prepilin-type N-terminal cleavage/methylation domain-containing protein